MVRGSVYESPQVEQQRPQDLSMSMAPTFSTLDKLGNTLCKRHSYFFCGKLILYVMD